MTDRLQPEFEEIQLDLATALAQRVWLDHRIEDLLKRRELIRSITKREREERRG